MEPQKQPLVSVLTPVYNGESHLAECIESVLAQTYQDWEYIIVNNCSTDRTLEIAEHYASRDRRIRVCTNEKFVSALRNHNIALTKFAPGSKYCKILQADDCLFPTCLEEMVKVGEAHPSVGVVSSYRLWDVWVDCDGLPYPTNFLPGKVICRLTLLGGLEVFGAMSTVLMRSDLVRKRGMLYNEVNIHADFEACFDLLQESDFGFVHQVLTYTRMHEQRLSSFSWRFHTRPIAQVDLIKKYGTTYLSPADYDRCLRHALDDYYRMLGNNVFKLREKAFWEYHRNALRELGYSFSLLRLARGAMQEALDVFLEPIKILLRQARIIREHSGERKTHPKAIVEARPDGSARVGGSTPAD